MPKIDEAVVGIRKLTTNLDGNITQLSANLQQSSDAARGRNETSCHGDAAEQMHRSRKPKQR